MKAGLFISAAATVAALAMAWSCTIDRRSSALECSQQSDCDDIAGTVCTNGYCVEGVLPPDAFACPAACNGGCDGTTCLLTGNNAPIDCPAGFACKITCSQAAACGAITCSGVSCDVTCTGSAACTSVTCNGTTDCKRTCSGASACGAMTCAAGDCFETCSAGVAACGALTCGSGQCSATCQGTDSACGDVSCGNSCQCDVNCGGNNTCPTNMTCPDPPGGTAQCEDASGRCVSSTTPQKCQKCQ